VALLGLLEQVSLESAEAREALGPMAVLRQPRAEAIREVLLLLVTKQRPYSMRLAHAAASSLSLCDPVPPFADAVVLSDDLLPHILTKLHLHDCTTAAVCRAWRRAWRRLCPQLSPGVRSELHECGLSLRHGVEWTFEELERRQAALATWCQQYAYAISPLRTRGLAMLRCHREGVPTLLGLTVIEAAFGARVSQLSKIKHLPQGLRDYVEKLKQWADPRITELAEGNIRNDQGAPKGWDPTAAANWLQENRHGPVWYVPRM